MAGPASLQPGTTFAGDFLVDRALSAGGMGAVYVVKQLSTGRQRALKLMLPQLVADEKSRARFEQEASIGARIASEHVVEVVGAGVDPATGTPWLAMEMLRGEDLASMMRRTGPLHPAAALEIVQQLCHAVGAAHAAGIVHRDLKPENVFVAETKRSGASTMVKVLDFGIAKVVAEAKMTETAAVGSPMWMAPEQTARGGFVGPQTDVWAIGLIVFHLLTGRFFWRAVEEPGGTAGQLLREIVMDAMPPASVRAAELRVAVALPPGFDAWFARSTDRVPVARFPDATQQLGALAALYTGGALGLEATAAAHVPLRVATIVHDPASSRASPGASTTAPMTSAGGSVPPSRASTSPRMVSVALAQGIVGVVGLGGLVWALGSRGAPSSAPAAAVPPPAASPNEQLELSLDALRAGAYDKRTVDFCLKAYETAKDLIPKVRRDADGVSDAVKFGPARLRQDGPMCFAKAGDCAKAWTVYKEAWAADPDLSPASRRLNDEALRFGLDAITNRKCAGK